MSSLKQALDELAQARRTAAMDTNIVPRETRQGQEGAKRRAVEAIPLLEEAVVAAAVPSSVIAVAPAADSDPAALVRFDAFLQDHGGIVVDAGRWADEYAAKVEAMYSRGDRQFSFNHFARLQSLYVREFEQAVPKERRGAFRDLVFHPAMCYLQEETARHAEALLTEACGMRWWVADVRAQLKAALVQPDRFSGRGKIPVLLAGRMPAGAIGAGVLHGLPDLFSRTVAPRIDESFEPSVEAVKEMFSNKQAETAKTNNKEKQ